MTGGVKQRVVAAACALALVCSYAAVQTAPAAPAASIGAIAPSSTSVGPQTPAPERPSYIPESFTFAAMGDAIGPVLPVLPRGDPDFAKVVAILKSADVGYANEEGSVFDMESFRGYTAAENGGGTPLYAAAVARDYKEIGIDMMSKANNHATDWGVEGLLATDAALDAGGVVHAGSGVSEAAARAPVFYESPKGRVALISTASTFTSMAPAGPPHVARQSGSTEGVQVGPRPGISVLRTQKVTLVSAQQIEVLRQIAGTSGADAESLPSGNAVLRLGTQLYRAADEPGITFTINPDDENTLLQSIRDARKVASTVVFAIHAHETAGGSEDPRPADFLPSLFHEAIDAGATIVVRTGPHALQGIEIYKGKPIFYGMGSIFFSPGADGSHRLQSLSIPDSWYDGAVAITRFRRGQLSEIRIYPMTIVSNGGPMAGTPRPAAPGDAQRILARLQHDSAQFGTKMEIRQGVGVIIGPG